MKNINTISEMVFAFFMGFVSCAVLLLAAGCNESVPLGRHDAEQCESDLTACEESEDFAWSQVAEYEEHLLSAHNIPDVGDTDYVRTETPEPVETKTETGIDALAKCELERSSWEAETCLR